MTQVRKKHYRYEAREVAYNKLSHEVQAISVDMLLQAIDDSFPPTLNLQDCTLKQWDAALAITAATMSAIWGLRPSILARTVSEGTASKHCDHLYDMAVQAGARIHGDLQKRFQNGHAILVADVTFGFRNSQSGFPDEWYPALTYASRPEGQGRSADLMVMATPTSKTNQAGGRPKRYFSSTDSSELEALFIRMAGMIADHAQYDSSDNLFFSRPQRSGLGRRDLRSKDLSDCSKGIATKHGLPRGSFSAKSFKNQKFSLMSAEGNSDQEVASALGHASARSSQHYIRPVMESRADETSGEGRRPYTALSVERNLSATKMLGYEGDPNDPWDQILEAGSPFECPEVTCFGTGLKTIAPPVTEQLTTSMNIPRGPKRSKPAARKPPKRKAIKHTVDGSG
jgi:hypothetical protein